MTVFLVICAWLIGIILGFGIGCYATRSFIYDLSDQFDADKYYDEIDTKLKYAAADKKHGKK